MSQELVSFLFPSWRAIAYKLVAEIGKETNSSGLRGYNIPAFSDVWETCTYVVDGKTLT